VTWPITPTGSRRTREEAQLIDGLHDLVRDEAGTRLAGVLRLEVGELLRSRLHLVGDAEQRQLPFAGRGVAPDREGGGCGGVGGIHVTAVRYRERPGVLFGDRIDERHAVGAARGHVAAADEVLQRRGVLQEMTGHGVIVSTSIRNLKI